jgi:hypothetical protein
MGIGQPYTGPASPAYRGQNSARLFLTAQLEEDEMAGMSFRLKAKKEIFL